MEANGFDFVVTNCFRSAGLICHWLISRVHLQVGRVQQIDHYLPTPVTSPVDLRLPQASN